MQQPIPIWIGGNAKVTRARVAERAQGWMPLLVPPEVAKTTRSPAIGGLDEVVAMMKPMRETAQERGVELDLASIPTSGQTGTGDGWAWMRVSQRSSVAAMCAASRPALGAAVRAGRSEPKVS